MASDAGWVHDPVGVVWVVCWWCKPMSWSEDTRPGTAVVGDGQCVLETGVAGVSANGAVVLGETWQPLDQL